MFWGFDRVVFFFVPHFFVVFAKECCLCMFAIVIFYTVSGYTFFIFLVQKISLFVSKSEFGRVEYVR